MKVLGVRQFSAPYDIVWIDTFIEVETTTKGTAFVVVKERDGEPLMCEIVSPAVGRAMMQTRTFATSWKEDAAWKESVPSPDLLGDDEECSCSNGGGCNGG